MASYHSRIAWDLLPPMRRSLAGDMHEDSTSSIPTSTTTRDERGLNIDISSSSTAEEVDAHDGFAVLARGLGTRNVLLTFLKIHAHNKNLVLLLNTSSREFDQLRMDLAEAAASIDFGLDVGGDEDSDIPRIELDCFREVNAETPAAVRSSLYLAGGVVSVTSRILIVDMLNNVLPLHLLTGVIINHAHKVTENSHETFILRIMRDSNKVAFIKAFTDSPESLTQGAWKLEKSMKHLFLRKVFFWPRFHVDVRSAIDSAGQINLHEIRVSMSKNMKEVQTAIVACIEECLAEIRRTSKSLDPDELTLEQALSPHLATTIRSQLDSIWHRVPFKTRQLINDLTSLRRLLNYLGSYDCVTFNSFLDAIRATNTPDPLAGIRGDLGISPWLMMDAADAVFKAARRRVFVRGDEKSSAVESEVGGATHHDGDGKATGIKPVLEEQPKWKTLIRIMKEVHHEQRRFREEGKVCHPILIMADGDRTCNQLREILSGVDLSGPTADSLSRSPQKRKRGEETAPIAPSSQHTGDGRRRKRGGPVEVGVSRESDANNPTKTDTTAGPTFSSDGTRRLLTRMFSDYLTWRRVIPTVQKNFGKKSNSSMGNTSARGGSAAGQRGAMRGARGGVSNRGRGVSTAFVRRRVRGGAVGGSAGTRSRSLDEPMTPTTFEDEAQEAIAFLDSLENKESDEPISSMPYRKAFDPDLELDEGEFDHFYSLVPVVHEIVIRPYACSSAMSGQFSENGDEDSRALESLQPQWVIMYDVDVAFVRRLEVFKATHKHLELNVFFMVYDESVEEQRYLSTIRKEKEAFEKLIYQKSVMAIPIDQDGRVEMHPEERFWQAIDTRIAGGQRIPASEARQIIVDVREFGSALPSVLYSRPFKLKPCTLEVGDYILTPHICVERKSISDLIQSFKSGRLYTQVEAMSLHYAKPVLLIEFANLKSFGMGLTPSGVSTGAGALDMTELQAKLSLLVLTFPKLRIIWSVSPSATAEIFEDLKKDQPEPSMETAMSIGTESGSAVDSVYSITPSEMIRALPGITDRNYRFIMTKVSSFHALVNMSLEELQKLMGDGPGKILYEFLNNDPRKQTFSIEL